MLAVGWCVVAVCAMSTPGMAQVTLRTTGEELGEVFKDVGYLWGAPFRAEPRDWAATGLTAAGFAALLSLDARVDRWFVTHERAVVLEPLAPFRETGPLTRLVTAKQLVPISASLVLAGALTGRRGLREAGYGCIAAWGMSNTLRYTIYFGLSRPRPSVAEGDAHRFSIPGGRKWNDQSFPAGHAANAFACATFWSERFDLSVGEPALYVTAALAALSRLADRRHWTSDTFVGVVVGYAIGRTLAGRYDRREARREADRSADTARIAARHLGLVTPPVVILWSARF